MTRFGRQQVQPCPAALAKPLLPSLTNSTQLKSPTDALIDRKVWHRLGRLIPVWDWLNGFTGLRITVIQQRRPACRGEARRLCLCPYMLQYLADVGALRDEGDDAHLPDTQGAQQREHLIDAGHQHRPEIVRRALGRHRLGSATFLYTLGGVFGEGDRDSDMALRVVGKTTTETIVFKMLLQFCRITFEQCESVCTLVRGGRWFGKHV